MPNDTKVDLHSKSNLQDNSPSTVFHSYKAMKFITTVLSIALIVIGLVSAADAAPKAPAGSEDRVYYCQQENFEPPCTSQKFVDKQCINIEEEYDNKVMSFTALSNVNCILYRGKNCEGPRPKNIGSDRLPTLERFRGGLSSFRCEDQTD